jgi:hypothetical protein
MEHLGLWVIGAVEDQLICNHQIVSYNAILGSISAGRTLFALQGGRHVPDVTPFHADKVPV